MTSDAATPATPATDDQVPAPRSGSRPVAVPEPAPDPDAPGDRTPDEPADAAVAGPDAPEDGAATVAPDVPVPDVPELSADDARGGRLAARLGEAQARLAPEGPVIPAPRSPGGVVPPPALRRSTGAPAADLVASLRELRGAVAAVEDAPDAPERRALARTLELSAAGIPDAGWSLPAGLGAEALAGAAALAGTLLAAGEALVERLDADGRAGSAVEVDAVVTALRVARVVLDLESFGRHGR